MSSISLTASVRSSLSALKTTSLSLSTTTDRLSTGKKVASAIDNPTNFFAASNYNQRADSLTSRLDAMSEATQMINAADNGITTIRSYLSQMKGVVNNALSNTDSDQRAEDGKQFNELIKQVEDVAKDSSYGGINLIHGNASTTVQFGENIDDSNLKLQGFNISAASGGVDANGEIGSSGVTDSAGNAYALTLDLDGSNIVGIRSAGTNGVGGGGGGANANLTALYNHLSGFTLSTSNTYNDLRIVLSDADYNNNLTSYLTNLTGKSANAAYAPGEGTVIVYDTQLYSNARSHTLTDLYNQIVSDVGGTNSATDYLMFAINTLSGSLVDLGMGGSVGTLNAVSYNEEVAQLGTSLGGGSGWSVDWSGADYKTSLTNVTGQIEKVENSLQTQSSKLANNLAIITQREDYTNKSIDILQNGADDLTLANLNEEGANLLSLQTSQSLAVQALSLSSSSAANVLNIIR